MFEDYKKSIRTVIQLLVNEGYNPQEILNILKFNDLEILEVELKQKNKKSGFMSTQLSLVF